MAMGLLILNQLLKSQPMFIHRHIFPSDSEGYESFKYHNFENVVSFIHLKCISASIYLLFVMFNIMGALLIMSSQNTGFQIVSSAGIVP
jgi:hypothetical protein